MENDIMSKIKNDIQSRRGVTRQTYSFGGNEKGFGFGFFQNLSENLSNRGIGSVKTHKQGTGRTRSFERTGTSAIPTYTRSFSNPYHRRQQQEALKAESFRGPDYPPDYKPRENIGHKFVTGHGKTKSY